MYTVDNHAAEMARYLASGCRVPFYIAYDDVIQLQKIKQKKNKVVTKKTYLPTFDCDEQNVNTETHEGDKYALLPVASPANPTMSIITSPCT